MLIAFTVVSIEAQTKRQLVVPSETTPTTDVPTFPPTETNSGSQNSADSSNSVSHPQNPYPTPNETGKSSKKREVGILIRATITGLKFVCAEINECVPLQNPTISVPVTPVTPLFNPNSESFVPRSFDARSSNQTRLNSKTSSQKFYFTPIPAWKKSGDYQKGEMTVVPPDGYAGNEIVAGLILGTRPLTYGNLQTGAENYLKGILSVNSHLTNQTEFQGGFWKNKSCMSPLDPPPSRESIRKSLPFFIKIFNLYSPTNQS